jgi:hypothetical protein
VSPRKHSAVVVVGWMCWSVDDCVGDSCVALRAENLDFEQKSNKMCLKWIPRAKRAEGNSTWGNFETPCCERIKINTPALIHQNIIKPFLKKKRNIGMEGTKVKCNNWLLRFFKKRDIDREQAR